MKLKQKLVELRKKLPLVKKDGESFGYNYVTGPQLMNIIQPAMNDLGLLLVPEIIGYTHETIEGIKLDKNGKEKPYIKRSILGQGFMVWMDSDSEEEIRVPWLFVGEQDDFSKAFGSSLTYSERYFYLKFFSIPTDADDPDNKGNKAPTQYKKNDDGDNKIWLEETMPEFNQAKAAIKQGIRTIVDIRKKFKVSKKIAELLTQK